MKWTGLVPIVNGRTWTTDERTQRTPHHDQTEMHFQYYFDEVEHAMPAARTLFSDNRFHSRPTRIELSDDEEGNKKKTIRNRQEICAFKGTQYCSATAAWRSREGVKDSRTSPTVYVRKSSL